MMENIENNSSDKIAIYYRMPRKTKYSDFNFVEKINTEHNKFYLMAIIKTGDLDTFLSNSWDKEINSLYCCPVKKNGNTRIKQGYRISTLNVDMLQYLGGKKNDW